MTLVENLNDPASISKKPEPAESNIPVPEFIPISRLRQSIPQMCAVSAKNLLLIALGTIVGFPTILLPALQKDDPDVPVTLEDITWIGSITLLVGPLGCLASGPLCERIGRKRTMLIANIPIVVGWVLLYYASTSTMLYIPMSLMGLTGGLIEGPVLVYVSEVTQAHLRGPLSATASMAVILGVFIELLAGSLADWRNVALMNIALPTLCVIVLSLVPESPYWLAGKGRVKEAERALCFLRGWVKPSHIKDELGALIMKIEESSKQRNSDDGKKVKFWEPYLKRTVTRPLFLVTLVYFADAFGGTASLQTYAVSIFEHMNSPIHEYHATVYLGVAEIMGTLVCVSTIHFTGKRRLSFFSIFGTGLCFLCSAIYSYLLQYDLIDSKAWTWIPTTLLIGSAFVSHVGIKLLGWILIGEVFPATVRAGASGIASSIAYLLTSMANKTFLYMVNGMEMSGTFIFFTAVNLIIGIILYFILPETEGRTLQEIEEHYAGISNLKNKPKTNALPFKEKWTASNPIVVTDNLESRL